MISKNGPLAVQAILRSIRETEGLPENDAFKIDTQTGHQVFLSRGRQGRPARVQGEARPEFKMK